MTHIKSLLYLALLGFCTGVSAQAFPSKAVRMVVAWPPGGGADIMARILSEPLSRTLGQQVIVDNRGGSNGIIGAEAVARAAPDGYTILFHSITSHVINPAIVKKLPYDTITDFAPITQVASVPLVIVVHPSFPVKTIRDLIVLAKARPGEINFASFGAASMSHLAGEQLNLMAGIRMVHIPYKGGGPALIDTLAGHVPVYFSGIQTSYPHIQSGRLRALAVTSPSRMKQFSELPTVAETTGLKDYDAAVMFATWAPAKTPRDILNRLHGDTVKALQAPEFRSRLEREGASEPIGNTPEQMTATIRSDMERLGKLVKAANIQLQ